MSIHEIREKENINSLKHRLTTHSSADGRLNNLSAHREEINKNDLVQLDGRFWDQLMEPRNYAHENYFLPFFVANHKTLNEIIIYWFSAFDRNVFAV